MAAMKRRAFVKGLAVATAGTALAQQQKAPPQAQNPVPSTSTVDQGAAATAPNTASSSTARARLQQQAQFHTPNIPVTTPDVLAVTQTGYFTPQRYATLVRFSQLVSPASQGYPGAVEAGTPQFLDFLIGGSPAERQAMYNNGLDRLNADSMKQNKVSFDKTSAAQADAVLRPYLKPWINDHPPTETHEKFVALVHRDIRTATLNSPAWAAAAEAAGERTPGVGLFVAPLDPGIELWVSNGMPKGSAPVTKHAHA